MRELSDDFLLEELKNRFRENRNTLQDLLVVTKKLEAVNEKLRQSESLKSNFLSNIRNEINNPLSVVLGMSKQLAGNTTDPQTVELMATMIYREAFELDFQLKNIFMAAEIESGELSVGISRTNVDGLIRELMGSFAQKAAEKKVALCFLNESSSPDHGLSFNTDVQKLSCILANLLANAIEYNHEDKTVHIAVRKKSARLEVSIADEGVGIPEQDRSRIFDRFMQLDIGTKKRHRGHGLGLSVAKALAEALGGTIALSCPSVTGCVFTLALPEASGGQTYDSSETSDVYLFDGAQKF